ncbi:MAG: hypothetical protein EPN53_02895 [Acidobacteria bacterium]|nr:MAG: hypothetical protein EPN53_02895 [Acidobacteriota bacterium]
MRIEFTLGETPIEFRRDWFTGRAELLVGGHVVPLQSPFDPRTHFSFALTRIWRHRIAGHEVVIEKTRPRLVAGFRSQVYRVLVDGEVAAERDWY